MTIFSRAPTHVNATPRFPKHNLDGVHATLSHRYIRTGVLSSHHQTADTCEPVTHTAVWSIGQEAFSLSQRRMQSLRKNVRRMFRNKWREHRAAGRVVSRIKATIGPGNTFCVISIERCDKEQGRRGTPLDNKYSSPSTSTSTGSSSSRRRTPPTTHTRPRGATTGHRHQSRAPPATKPSHAHTTTAIKQTEPKQ